MLGSRVNSNRSNQTNDIEIRHDENKNDDTARVSLAAGTRNGHARPNVSTRSGNLDFELGVPTKETVTKLYDEMDYQRACQLYLWALPIVGFANLQVILVLCPINNFTGAGVSVKMWSEVERDGPAEYSVGDQRI